jgi:hypothetical protein
MSPITNLILFLDFLKILDLLKSKNKLNINDDRV